MPFEFEEMWDEAILEYLESGGKVEDLESLLGSICGTLFGDSPEPIKAQVISADLNLDRREDVVVSITMPYGNGFGEAHVIAYLANEQGYQPHILFRRAGAGSAAEGLYQGGGPQILAVSDINRDGNVEFVVSVRWPAYAEVFIGQWIGDSYRSLIEVYSEMFLDTIYYINVNFGSATLDDTNNDGILELVITEETSYPWFGALPIPERPAILNGVVRRETWSWDGEAYQPTAVEYDPPPEYRFEAVLYGDFIFRYGLDYSQALNFYQQAIFDESLLGWSQGYDPAGDATLVPDPQERARLEAYARYRIVILHAKREDLASANISFDSLQSRFPPGSEGHAYAQLATAFWEVFEESGSYSSACEAAEEFAVQHPSDILTLLGRAFYGEFGWDYTPDYICPASGWF